MSDAYVVAVEGLSALHTLESLPKNVVTAALRALNSTADRSAAASRREVGKQVNFSARYLTGTDASGNQRLGVSKRARGTNLEAVITGRARPTMLARFVTSGTVGKAGVRVEVAPGFAKLMKSAFLIRLPAGKGGNVETNSNLGLAIRLKPGETIQNKKQMIQLKNGLYLLFGPSVDQVFKDVAEAESIPAADFLETEFLRLIDLDLK